MKYTRYKAINMGECYLIFFDIGAKFYCIKDASVLKFGRF